MLKRSLISAKASYIIIIIIKIILTCTFKIMIKNLFKKFFDTNY